MEIKVKYFGLADRQTKILENEAKGLRMLHDDFDPDWKPGEEPRGVLTFTDIIPNLTPEPEIERDYGREIDEIRAMINEIKTKLELIIKERLVK